MSCGFCDVVSERMVLKLGDGSEISRGKLLAKQVMMMSTPRFRSTRCVLTTVTLVLIWWAVLLVKSVHMGRGFTSRDHDMGVVPSYSGAEGEAVESGEGGTAKDACEGRYIYMYEMPAYFNQEMVSQCENLSLWTNWCPSVQNAGLGPPMEFKGGADWYITNQFMLEQIFHNRMRRYECLTQDATRAAAVFVPFYAGFEITTKLWAGTVAARDAAPARLAAWLAPRAEWARWGGHDHFLVGGRVTWDFRRATDAESDWGNKLFSLDFTANMTMLTIEASPWHKNDVAIPYPTYFHPSTRSSLANQQANMRAGRRTTLFSFVGAPRPALKRSIRGKIIDQCEKSQRCALLHCRRSACLSPQTVMAVFARSVFCLQPSGDSFTRRSTFDAMLAGCIPVFFHRSSAYDQYLWHLPRDATTWSVFIPEAGVRNGTTRIEAVLAAFSDAEVAAMRESVVRVIPSIVYADPRASPIAHVRDAFDITVQGVIDRITKKKRDMAAPASAASRTADEEVMKERAATEDAMKKSEAATGWREHNGFANV